MLRRLTRHRLFIPGLVALGALTLAGIATAWALGVDPRNLATETARWWREEQPSVRRWADAHPMLAPVALYTAVAVLPTFMLPVSPLLALCGALLGPAWGTLVAGLGMMTNAVGTFGIARRCRVWVEPRVLRAGYDIPKLSAENTGMIIVPMRIIPGVPFVFQNYMLGLAGTPKRSFLGWVVAIETPCAAPYVLVGAGAMQGRSDLMIAGGALLFCVAVAAKFLRRRTKSETPVAKEVSTDA